jgi:hypothetical protein
MNPAQMVVLVDDPNTSLMWPFAVSAFAIGGPFGAFVGGSSPVFFLKKKSSI